MSSHPSFIYDQYRPGIETSTQAEMWSASREVLEKIIHGSARQIGALILKAGLGGAEDSRTRGEATIMRLYRVEPPMTADEARIFGNSVVAAWTAAASERQVPEYCDTIFTLQAETEIAPSS